SEPWQAACAASPRQRTHGCSRRAPYTHNLVNLESQLPDSIKFPATIDLGLLTTYAATTRYVLSEMPEDPDPTWADAQDALTWAEAIGKAVETWVVESGLGR
ncbi:MAG: hypothetical protein ACC726_12515, partial [Chloroflexota bacterium]